MPGGVSSTLPTKALGDYYRQERLIDEVRSGAASSFTIRESTPGASHQRWASDGSRHGAYVKGPPAVTAGPLRGSLLRSSNRARKGAPSLDAAIVVHAGLGR